MAEALADFVARRRPAWDALTAQLDALRSGKATLESLISLEAGYRQAASDLAHAQAAYPSTEVTAFLHQLCARAYGAIYRLRVDRWSALRDFYRVTLPRLARENLRFTAFAAGLLALGVLTGFTTVALAPSASVLLVSDNLRSAIERGELWTDKALDVLSPSSMAVQIFTNNVRVAFSSFALGLTAGVGTVSLLIFNGLAVGAIVAACMNGGLAGGILEFMAAHGPVELSIIAISGGGGLMLGDALIAPGERPRVEVLRTRARDAMQLVLGCAPVLVMIGVVEGFVSPGSLVPWPLKVAFGALSAFAFWRYLLTPPRPRAGAPV
ncbi:MAG: stage II sporulation protein M [Archangium sp.]|nr:stage II sporulation protein M [Archangium sp.]